jgi:prephenate dehydratase
MKDSVSIQGYLGSFTHIAADKMLGEEVELRERSTFEEVFQDVINGVSTYGLVAIHNSIFGDIPDSTRLLKAHSELKVVNTLDLLIEQNLIVIPGTQFPEICEVHSQLPALEQCQIFLKKYPQWKQVETEDTALSVADMMEAGKKSVAAIGSSLAAKTYGAEILLANIHDSKNNITSFSLFQK